MFNFFKLFSRRIQFFALGSKCSRYRHVLEYQAILEDLNYKIVPKTFRRFVAAMHVFKRVHFSSKFLEILNKQDPPIKYTVQFEDHKHLLNFLTSNTNNKKYEFKIHRKDAITNIHIKSNSCIDPSITKSVFKGFLHRAHTICSEKYIKGETQFLVDMFVEKGHKKTFLETLVKDYNSKKKNSDSRKLHQLKENPWVPIKWTKN